MSPEERECILRIIHLLSKKRRTAKKLVTLCGEDDILGRYKRHSIATVYKALNYLEHYNIIRKEQGGPKGRGRPPKIYILRTEALGGERSKESFRFSESFAYSMFKHYGNLESALGGYRADIGLFTDHFLKSEILSQLEKLPLSTKKEVKELKKTLNKTIDLDCEELKLLAKKYVELILEKFGTNTRN